MSEKSKKIIWSILVPALISLSGVIITVIANRRNAIYDSQRQLLQKESHVLNKISEIADESELVVVAFIERQRIHEVHITSYINQNKEVQFQDTSYHDYPKRDTTYYFIPRFAYYSNSCERVHTNLKYIEEHLYDLSHKTYEQANDLLLFVTTHPITTVQHNEEDLSKSEWSKEEVYATFINKVGKMNQSYLKRLKRLGLE